VSLPELVGPARRICEKGLNIPNAGFKTFNTYESTLPYTLRFMVDQNLRGGGWVELPAGKYKVRNAGRLSSHCQLEVDIDYRVIKGHDSEGEWARMAPMRVLSFDIECAGRKGFFPKADMDPVIQIASCVSLQGRPGEPIIKNIFTLRGCAAIAGAQVVPNASEKEMLMGWLQMFVQSDPGQRKRVETLFCGKRTTHVEFCINLLLVVVVHSQTSSPATTSSTSIFPTCWIVRKLSA
jgi:DNA polymerase delta subunit 1